MPYSNKVSSSLNCKHKYITHNTLHNCILKPLACQIITMYVQDSRAVKNLPLFLFILWEILLFFTHASSAGDSISRLETLFEGKTLVSEDGSFELGFFSPGSSSNRYLGIWYKPIPVKTVVWVANGANSVKDNSSTLHINNEGELVIENQNRTVVWSAKVNSIKKALNPIAQLLDNGNLVVRDEVDQDPENYLWQSFDYPSDTLLPGMKLGWDLKTGLERRVTAWKNWDDPSPGDFSWGISLEGVPQIMMWNGSKEYYRGGTWNGVGFSGAPELKTNQLFQYKFISSKDEVYFMYNLNKLYIFIRIVMNQTTLSRHLFLWIKEDKAWRDFAGAPRDYCDYYNPCGPNANCIKGDSRSCQCLTGFKPKSQESWDKGVWTQGCTLSEQLSCKDKSKDEFLMIDGLKYPDTSHAWVNESMNLDQCRDRCFENCSCTAYANSDIRRGGSGCFMWFGDLIDIRSFTEGGPGMYIRMKISEIGGVHEAAKEGSNKKVAVKIIIGASVLVLTLVLCYFGKRIIRFKAEETENNLLVNNSDASQKEDLELPIFDLATIVKATDGFSISNKLGEGGFGTVYMGTLVDGQEIAVKRLSRSSRQGVIEFKNEVLLIAKLQHRNLVKLLGCCIQGEEKMLVYEYMPNKSLDSFIFNHVKARLLNWSNRLNIIWGVARGLLYLHQDSRLRIIHRDLKASNVLLDNELNAKISDFGMAKTFGGDQTEGNTNRVVGTYGYIAPEYAIHGLFSIKSDVFSFGVLLLEIISGMKNRSVSHASNKTNLIGHAWILWKERRPLDLIDSCMEQSYVVSEALRCIHISLLCVQQHPDDRPTMSNVVLMLGSESALPEPKEPAFLTENYSLDTNSSSKQISSSNNEMSVTILEPR